MIIAVVLIGFDRAYYLLKMSLDWIPAREITPKERGNRGIIPTKKNHLGEVQYESCLERDLLLLAIHCPGVTHIRHQPETITYTDKKGKPRRYTPDVYLEFVDGNRYLIEVKFEDDIISNKLKYEERWEAARRHAFETGMKFIVLHENQIRKPRMFNVWFTLGPSKCHINDGYMDKINQIIPSTGVEYNSLCHVIAKEFGVNISKAAQIVCYAIYHGLVFIENFSNIRLSPSTLLYRLSDANRPPFALLYEDFCENQVNDDSESNTSHLHSLSTSEITSPNCDSRLEDREKMMMEWFKRPKYLRTTQWRADFCNKWNISKSQFYRLLERYVENGRRGLKSMNGNAGRKTVFDEIVLKNMELGRDFFIKNTLVTFSQAYNHLRKLCEDDGATPPSFSAFKKFVYRNSRKLDRDSRKGKEYVKTYYQPSLKSFQGAYQCLQVVEFDNSCCNIFIADEEKREYVDRPKMTAGIDCKSGMITGFNVSHFDSSSRSVLEALVQTILPKNDYTEVFNTQHDWSIQGIPVAILVDNGMDYRAKNLADFCKRYDIILEFVPIRTPRYKAYIEQFFNVLTKAMFQESLPGVDVSLTRRLIDPALKPEKDATLTLSELEEWMHKWIVDTYHHTNRYADHKYAPHYLLNEIEDKKNRIILPLPRESPTDPQEIDELYLSILQPTKRKLSKNGVQWEFLFYNNTQLSSLFHKIGDVQIEFLRDRRDVRRVWVIDPESNVPFLVGLGMGWGKALLETYNDKPVTESEWIKRVRWLQKRIKKTVSPYLFKTHISAQMRLEAVENAKKEQKKVRREREKTNETIRKGFDEKLLVFGKDNKKVGHENEIVDFPEYIPNKMSNATVNEEKASLATYVPKMLSTSEYPKKKLPGE